MLCQTSIWVCACQIRENSSGPQKLRIQSAVLHPILKQVRLESNKNRPKTETDLTSKVQIFLGLEMFCGAGLRSRSRHTKKTLKEIVRN